MLNSMKLHILKHRNAEVRFCIMMENDLHVTDNLPIRQTGVVAISVINAELGR